MEITKGLLHYYYGFGPGKTSSVIGRIVRSIGQQKHPILLQFLKKHDPTGTYGFIYGEYITLTEMLHIPVYQFGLKKFILRKEDVTDDLREEIVIAMEKIKELMKTNEYDLIILDEIGSALQLNLINLAELVQILRNRTTNAEIMMTGHTFIPEIADVADYINEIREKKHPYKLGILARAGVEY